MGSMNAFLSKNDTLFTGLILFLEQHIQSGYMISVISDYDREKHAWK
jgi:hypothetical protein